MNLHNMVHEIESIDKFLIFNEFLINFNSIVNKFNLLHKKVKDIKISMLIGIYDFMISEL